VGVLKKSAVMIAETEEYISTALAPLLRREFKDLAAFEQNRVHIRGVILGGIVEGFNETEADIWSLGKAPQKGSKDDDAADDKQKSTYEKQRELRNKVLAKVRRAHFGVKRSCYVSKPPVHPFW
jgi:hypothetical protein